MLDIRLIRSNPELVRQAIRTRGGHEAPREELLGVPRKEPAYVKELASGVGG